MFVYGVFPTNVTARRAVEALTGSSFPVSMIGAALYEEAGVKSLHVEQSSSVGRGAAIGAAIGLGATALVGVGGGLLATASLLAAIEAIAAAGIVGSFTGAIASLGFWRNALELPPGILESGAIVVGVETITRCDEALGVLQGAGATSTAAVSLGGAGDGGPSDTKG